MQQTRSCCPSASANLRHCQHWQRLGSVTQPGYATPLEALKSHWMGSCFREAPIFLPKRRGKISLLRGTVMVESAQKDTFCQSTGHHDPGGPDIQPKQVMLSQPPARLSHFPDELARKVEHSRIHGVCVCACAAGFKVNQRTCPSKGRPAQGLVVVYAHLQRTLWLVSLRSIKARWRLGGCVPCTLHNLQEPAVQPPKPSFETTSAKGFGVSFGDICLVRCVFDRAP